jgi:LPS sulfotransferase NodH
MLHERGFMTWLPESEMLAARVFALRRVFPEYDLISRSILARLRGVDDERMERVTGRGYLLCITPRSGSSMLADVLGQTGSVGRAREHFPTCADAPLPKWLDKCSSLRDIFRILEKWAPAGYFGIKGCLLQMFPLISAGVFAGPGCIFRHIYLTRRDRLGQAISLARAVKTNEWHSHDSHVPDPDLNCEDIVYYLHHIRTMEAGWETVFTIFQLEPLRLYYEDLVNDRLNVFEQIRQYLGVQWEIAPAEIVSSFQCVSERHDSGWIKRLREMFETPPVPPA